MAIAAPGAQARHDDLGRAVTFMLVAAALIPLLNASAKYLVTQGYPVLEVTWARYAGHFAYMVIAFAPRRGLSLLASSCPGEQFLRSGLLCASTLIFITALRYVPLPTATAISFTSPFIVTVLAPILLGEQVGRHRWLAVAVGLVGALIVVRPGITGNDEASLLILASAVASALYQIMSRKLAGRDSAETSITYVALAGFFLTTIPLPFVWVAPASAFDLGVFLGLGLFGGFGHYFMVRAFELAPAPFVSPFTYGQLIGATLLSLVVFGQLPDAWVWTGAFVIALSGAGMLWIERAGLRRAPAAA